MDNEHSFAGWKEETNIWLKVSEVLLGWKKELVMTVKGQWLLSYFLPATICFHKIVCSANRLFTSALYHKPYLNSVNQNSRVCCVLLTLFSGLRLLRDPLVYQKTMWNIYTYETYFPEENSARNTWKRKTNRYWNMGKESGLWKKIQAA